MTDMQTDWRYSEARLNFRAECLNILLKKFGHQMDGVVPKYSSQSIYECAHDWVSQGHNITSGIVAYYQAYYDPTKRPNSFSEEGNQRGEEET